MRYIIEDARYHFRSAFDPRPGRICARAYWTKTGRTQAWTRSWRAMEELHRRYANGKAESMAALQADNPDIPWKSLANKAKEYFGNTLARHLKLEGIL